MVTTWPSLFILQMRELGHRKVQITPLRTFSLLEAELRWGHRGSSSQTCATYTSSWSPRHLSSQTSRQGQGQHHFHWLRIQHLRKGQRNLLVEPSFFVVSVTGAKISCLLYFFQSSSVLTSLGREKTVPIWGQLCIGCLSWLRRKSTWEMRSAPSKPEAGEGGVLRKMGD